MSGLAETLSRLSQFRGRVAGPDTPADARLSPLPFAPNPGELDAQMFVPPGLPSGAPLVVILHGCTQTAAGYDHGTGWSHLAERHGFAVLYPEQRRANNANLCFNWFSPPDVKRESGEALSIKSMIDTVVRAHRLDPLQVFITGLSAGGAMASAMLAVYPEMFAAGAIIAGLPFGVAQSVPEAFREMGGTSGRSGEMLGDLVRNASPAPARWPRVTVWHGTADRTVAPSNADAIVAQWLDVHHLPNRPSDADVIAGATRRRWRDDEGRAAVEAIMVPGMGHGVPLDTAQNADEVAGPFLLDVGLSSSTYALQSWGIAKPGVSLARAPSPRPVPAPVAADQADGWAYKVPPKKPGSTWSSTGGVDVSRVINDALRSAGLLR